MMIKHIAVYFARSCQVFMTIVLFLIIVHIVQAFGAGAAGWLIEATSPPVEKKQESARTLSAAEETGLKLGELEKEFLANGTIHLIENVYTDRQFKPLGRLSAPRVRIYDANLRILWEGTDSERPVQYQQYVPFESDRGFRWQKIRDYIKYEPQFQIEFSDSPLEIGVMDGEVIKLISQTWRYDPCRQHFVGYRTGFGKVGYIGANGFCQVPSETQPLGADGYLADSSDARVLWATVARLYEIDFTERKVKVLFERDAADILNVEAEYWWREPEVDMPEYSLVPAPLVIVGTKDGKYHLIIKDKAPVTVAVPGLRHSIEFAAVEDDGAFLKRYDSSAYPPENLYADDRLLQQWYVETPTKPTDHKLELYRVDADGGLHLLNSLAWTTPAEYSRMHVKSPDSFDVAWRYSSTASPYLYDLLMRIEWRPLGVVFQSFGLLWQAAWFWKPQILSLNLAVSALMVVLAFIHAWPRRVGWVRMVCWLVFVALFNAAGLLTYLALNHTTTIRCSACEKKRGLEGSACVRCGADLPVPERKAADLVLCA